MAKFAYRARKGPQELKQGTIEAETESGAISKLMQMGYAPIDITVALGEKEKSKLQGMLGKISHRDLATFTRQLSDLLAAGLTLFRALTVLRQQTEN